VPDSLEKVPEEKFIGQLDENGVLVCPIGPGFMQTSHQ